MTEYPRPPKIVSDLSNAQEFYEFLQPPHSGLGRKSENRDAAFLFMPDPLKRARAAIEHKSWRASVKAGIVRREEMLKGLPAMLKERLRVEVYDLVFGWILDNSNSRKRDLGKYPADQRDDVSLFS